MDYLETLDEMNLILRPRTCGYYQYKDAEADTIFEDMPSWPLATYVANAVEYIDHLKGIFWYGRQEEKAKVKWLVKKGWTPKEAYKIASGKWMHVYYSELEEGGWV